MDSNNLAINGKITFKLRFNTMHGDTDYYWRIIIDEQEYLARSLYCEVPTWSESSFDKKAGTIKYHMTGNCNDFTIDKEGKAVLK